MTRPFQPPAPRSGGSGRPDKLTQAEEAILSAGDFAMSVVDDIALRGNNTQYKLQILKGLRDQGFSVDKTSKVEINSNGGLDIYDTSGKKLTSLNAPVDYLRVLGKKTSAQANSDINRYNQLSQGAMGYTSQRGQLAPAPAQTPKAQTKPKRSAADNF